MATGEHPDPELAIAKYRAEASGYDRRTRLIDRYRRQAVERLRLAPGATVIDVACGTGANFEALEQRIGPRGRIIGIDLSPEMLELARQRVERRSWPNVTLVEATVDEAKLDVRADAALFSFTHDVLQSPAAIDNVLAHLRPGARVVAVGGRSPPRWLLPLHLAARQIGARYVTTLSGYERPWVHLAARLDDAQVKPRALGAVYLLRTDGQRLDQTISALRRLVTPGAPRRAENRGHSQHLNRRCLSPSTPDRLQMPCDRTVSSVVDVVEIRQRHTQRRTRRRG
jgi:demethylmenaquinone methyltransferase/2-methoxy-6-polyprenyl-1,4-benzoquinol methylase